jgi:hypothetical protein
VEDVGHELFQVSFVSAEVVSVDDLMCAGKSSNFIVRGKRVN